MRLTISLAFLLITRLALAAGIENATCEQTGPAKYRIDFANSDSGPVRIYASSSPDRIDSSEPVATVKSAPADVTVTGRTGRVYFHLKPAHGPVRVVAVRRLPLEGAANFRDLGGYRTSDGKYVRWGRVYRSNQLSMLTPRDYEYLAPLGIRVVCDLRTDYERKRMLTDWKAGSPEFLVAPVSDDRTITATMQEMKRAIESGQRPEANRQAVTYSDMLFQYSGQYAKVFHRIASDAGPSLTHCSGGADRTGIYAAILLAALCVPRDTIMADYLLTKQFLGGNPAAMAVTLQKLMDLDRPMDPAIQAKMMDGMTSNQMETMFTAIEGKYGSVENLLKEGFGLTATEVHSLRDRLLEP